MRRAEEATENLENLTQPTDKKTVVSTQPSLLTSMAIGTPRVLAAIMAVLLLVYFSFPPETVFLRRAVEIAPGLDRKETGRLHRARRARRDVTLPSDGHLNQSCARCSDCDDYGLAWRTESVALGHSSRVP